MAEKILIIDDDMDTLKLVGMMLQKQSYQIVAANNGIKGLELAEAENPDLILLDVMMPGMDGYEVAKRLRANPLTANTPILMFTAKAQLDDKVSGFEAGADDYLTKPTHPSELNAHVKALLARTAKGKVVGCAIAGGETCVYHWNPEPARRAGSLNRGRQPGWRPAPGHQRPMSSWGNSGREWVLLDRIWANPNPRRWLNSCPEIWPT